MQPYPSDDAARGGARAVPVPAPRGVSLALEGLTVRTRTGRALIEGVSLTASAGEIVGIVGPNGAGKTTLLRCIWGATRPSAGRVLIDGSDAAAITARERARRVAAVPQETPAGFALTVREVVETGRTPHARGLLGGDPAGAAAVAGALSRMGLDDLADRPFAELSGGERRRTLIARALAQGAHALLLDEPANHLDIRHQLDVMTLARALGATVLVTLHDIDLAARFCDRLAMLCDGRLIADGTPETVLSPERIARVFGVRAEIGRPAPGAPLRLHFERFPEKPERNPA
jgi:iron complex transport system ATP-binding protein